jgi:hypothetical protein
VCARSRRCWGGEFVGETEFAGEIEFVGETEFAGEIEFVGEVVGETPWGGCRGDVLGRPSGRRLGEAVGETPTRL